MIWIFYALIECLVSIKTCLCASKMVCLDFSRVLTLDCITVVIFEPTRRSPCWNALAVAPPIKYSTVTGESATDLNPAFDHPSIVGVFFFHGPFEVFFNTQPLANLPDLSVIPWANMSVFTRLPKSRPSFSSFVGIHLQEDPYQQSRANLDAPRHQHPPCMTGFQVRFFPPPPFGSVYRYLLAPHLGAAPP